MPNTHMRLIIALLELPLCLLAHIGDVLASRLGCIGTCGLGVSESEKSRCKNKGTEMFYAQLLS